MRAVVRILGWVGGLGLAGALLFLALRQSGVVEPARALLLSAAGVGVSPLADPCVQDETASAIVARIDYTDAHALHTLFDQVDVWQVESEQQTAVALVSPAPATVADPGGLSLLGGNGADGSLARPLRLPGPGRQPQHSRLRLLPHG